MRLEYFQMIDRFVEVSLGERRMRSVCSVPRQSTIFEGHFPGYPLMPGVLLIECMAQTAGWLAGALTGFTGLPVLAGVKEAKIRNAVFPGDELEFEGKVVHEGSGYSVGESRGWRKGKAICDATLVYRIIPYPSPLFRKGLLEIAERMDFPVKEFIE